MSNTWRGRATGLRENVNAVSAAAMLATALLSACGGGGGSSAPVVVTPPEVPPIVATAPAVPTGLSLGYDVKAFKLSWTAVAAPTGGGAVTYRVTEDPDGAGPQAATQVATDLTTTSHTQQVAGLLHTRLNATYTVQACNSAGCSALATPVAVDVNRVIGYFKASNTDRTDSFGNSVALSADGTTLAVGAQGEGSNATGINGDQADNSAFRSGAVYVFARNGNTWSQQAYIKASNTRASNSLDGGFGTSLALSADGTTLAVGASIESSNATGINGDQSNNLAGQSGAVYVFTRRGTNWSQQAYVKASNTSSRALFGGRVALSADGNTMAVGAIGESTAGAGSGAAYVFTRSGTNWSQQAFIKASNAEREYGIGFANLILLSVNFGASVALSADGTTLAVGANNERSGATGINGDQADHSAERAGAVYVFVRSGTTWSQQAYVKASNTRVGNEFGISVALSADGGTLVAGSGGFWDSSGGAVHVFARSAGVWSQQAYIESAYPGKEFYFASSVALSADGTTLAVGSYGEASNATGFNGNQADNSSAYAGATYLFRRSGTTWNQQAYIKASNTAASQNFGISLALSADGTTLAVGATGETSNATGINGNQSDKSLVGAGAVYLY